MQRQSVDLRSSRKIRDSSVNRLPSIRRKDANRLVERRRDGVCWQSFGGENRREADGCDLLGVTFESSENLAGRSVVDLNGFVKTAYRENKIESVSRSGHDSWKPKESIDDLPSCENQTSILSEIDRRDARWLRSMVRGDDGELTICLDRSHVRTVG